MQACVALELFSRQTGMIIAKQHVQRKKTIKPSKTTEK